MNIYADAPWMQIIDTLLDSLVYAKIVMILGEYITKKRLNILGLFIQILQVPSQHQNSLLSIGMILLSKLAGVQQFLLPMYRRPYSYDIPSTHVFIYRI